MACANQDTLGGDDVTEIEPRYLYKITSGNATQCFDLRDLALWIETKMRSQVHPINPYTNERFTAAQLADIERAIAESQKENVVTKVNVFMGFSTPWISPSSFSGLVPLDASRAISNDKDILVQWIRSALVEEEPTLHTFGNFSQQLQKIVSSEVAVSYEFKELEVPNTRFLDDRQIQQSRTQRCSYNVGNIVENRQGLPFRLSLQLSIKGLPDDLKRVDLSTVFQGIETFFKVRFFSGKTRQELKALEMGNVKAVQAVPEDQQDLAVPVAIGVESPLAVPVPIAPVV